MSSGAALSAKTSERYAIIEAVLFVLEIARVLRGRHAFEQMRVLLIDWFRELNVVVRSVVFILHMMACDNARNCACGQALILPAKAKEFASLSGVVS